MKESKLNYNGVVMYDSTISNFKFSVIDPDKNRVEKSNQIRPESENPIGKVLNPILSKSLPGIESSGEMNSKVWVRKSKSEGALSKLTHLFRKVKGLSVGRQESKNFIGFSKNELRNNFGGRAVKGIVGESSEIGESKESLEEVINKIISDEIDTLLNTPYKSLNTFKLDRKFYLNKELSIQERRISRKSGGKYILGINPEAFSKRAQINMELSKLINKNLNSCTKKEAFHGLKKSLELSSSELNKICATDLKEFKAEVHLSMLIVFQNHSFVELRKTVELLSETLRSELSEVMESQNLKLENNPSYITPLMLFDWLKTDLESVIKKKEEYILNSSLDVSKIFNCSNTNALSIEEQEAVLTSFLGFAKSKSITDSCVFLCKLRKLKLKNIDLIELVDNYLMFLISKVGNRKSIQSKVIELMESDSHLSLNDVLELLQLSESLKNMSLQDRLLCESFAMDIGKKIDEISTTAGAIIEMHLENDSLLEINCNETLREKAKIDLTNRYDLTSIDTSQSLLEVVNDEDLYFDPLLEIEKIVFLEMQYEFFQSIHVKDIFKNSTFFEEVENKVLKIGQ